jgi:hypothetical protein
MAEAWMSQSAEHRESSMVPWGNPTSYTFSRASVLLNAPERSGVYVLYSKTTWVYIGEGENIREQLLQHLDGPNACVSVFPDLTFSYELIPSPRRAWRQDELVSGLRPICNPWGR